MPYYENMSEEEIQTYELLCLSEAQGVTLRDADRAALELFKPKSGLILIKDDDGKCVMAIGSREEQIDRAQAGIIARIVKYGITPADRERLDRLSQERTARMCGHAKLRFG